MILCFYFFFFPKIIPSFFVDKASCTRQFESELSLHSLASFFPIKEGFFLPLRLSCKERLFSKTYPSFLTVKEGSTSYLGLLPSGKKRETALRCSEPLRSKVGGPSKVYAILCGMGLPDYILIIIKFHHLTFGLFVHL